jgi:hypothetical protein
MTAHPARLHRSTGGPRSLTAPREDRADRRRATSWVDRHADEGQTYGARSGSTADHVAGHIPVLSYRDYFSEYRAHPEHKALAVDGTTCHPWTRGVLQPPTVTTERLVRIGKESRPSGDEEPDPSEPATSEIVYAERSCPSCGKALNPRQVYCSEGCRKRHTRHVERSRSG